MSDLYINCLILLPSKILQNETFTKQSVYFVKCDKIADVRQILT